MPGKVTKQFAHLSVLIDLIHSLHHNQEIKELRDTVLQNTTENGQPGSIAMIVLSRIFRFNEKFVEVKCERSKELKSSTPVSWEKENPRGIILV